MPYARKSYKKNSRRKYGRSSNRTTSKATGRSLRGPIRNFMPVTCMRKMTYCDAITMTPGAGSYSHHVFRSNGCYDPDITGVGHQSRGFDQLMTAYKKYTVIGSKITVTQNRFIANAGWLYLTHSTEQDPMVATTANATRFESAQIVKKPVILADTSGGARKTRVSGQVSMKKFRRSKVLNEDDYSGSVTTNPADPSYWTVYYQNEGGNTPDSTTFLIEIEYIVVFRDPYPIVSS